MNVNVFIGRNRGCPALTPGEDQKVEYMYVTRTCRGEYEPFNNGGRVMLIFYIVERD